jgi:hypothetical protein
MNIEKLSYLYNLSKEQITKHYDILNIRGDEYCCHYEPKPYVETELSNFSKPINHMLDYYNNVNKYQFLSDCLAEAKNLDNKTIIKYSNDSYSNYAIRDEVILQYVTNRPKTFILTVWPCSVEFIDNIINFLHKNGVVTVCREIELSYLGGQNLVNYLYNKIILQRGTKERKMKFIDSKLLYSKFNKTTMNKIFIIVFENINDLPISGTGALFKTQLREYIKSLILSKYPKENIELPDTIHINDYFYETIEYVQTYFHEQTLLHLQKKILTNWLDEYFNPSFLRLNAFKNWQIKKLNILESQRLILLTGSSFCTTGIRKSSDIDSIFINLNLEENSEREKELENIIYNDFFNEETKIPFADSGMPGTRAWKQSWTESNDGFYNSFTEPIDDFYLALEPSMYYYWNGLKIMTFDLTIEFKLYRYIPSDYVDFIILRELYPNITDVDIELSKRFIWANKPNKSKEKINKLIINSFNRYLSSDKKKININKYLLQ